MSRELNERSRGTARAKEKLLGAAWQEELMKDLLLYGQAGAVIQVPRDAGKTLWWSGTNLNAQNIPKNRDTAGWFRLNDSDDVAVDEYAKFARFVTEYCRPKRDRRLLLCRR